MGKGIKTKSTVKDIKALDKSAVAAQRMKEAYIRTRDKAEHGMYAEEGSPGEYASDRLSAGMDNVTHEAVHQFDKQGRKEVQTTRENISKVKERIQKRKAAAEQPKKQAEKQAARQAGQPTIRWIRYPSRPRRSGRSCLLYTSIRCGSEMKKTVQ